MNAMHEELQAYLKRAYPAIEESLGTGTVSGNELWLLKIATEAFQAGFARGDARSAAQQYLSNLLARIHRDGGHYESEHGTKQAVFDADIIVADLYAEKDSNHDQGAR